jgi:hypothetical protein
MTMLLAGCAARSPAPAITAAHAPSHAGAFVAPPVEQGPALDTATHAATLYAHDTIDPESALPTAGGIIRVHAPFDAARSVALDFDHYWELNPDIETSRIIDKVGDATDVYLRVPTVLPDVYIWAVVRFVQVPASEGVAYRGTMVQGNLDDLRIFWRVVPRGDESIGQMEVLADPNLPLPKKWVVRDTREGIKWMLERFRDKAERMHRGGVGADGSVNFPEEPYLE